MVGSVTDVVPVVTALARTMEKIHQRATSPSTSHAPAQARFRGEHQDLEEMVGNLVDNACKWAQIARRPSRWLPTGPATSRPMVRIIIDDDGRGLAPQATRAVGSRGRRLDETKPGSGLGLSIVVELAALYGGDLTLGTAPIGGLRAELVLPAA